MTTITAKVIADSISPQNVRLTTLQLRYPRLIHSEVMTHRVFSRNASSSRAIPTKRLIQDVIDDPVTPIFWGKNQPGMQASEETDARLNVSAVIGLSHRFEMSREQAWALARTKAVEMAWAFEEAGYHKQIVNRLLEPFAHINVLVSSTSFDNFFALRRHSDADPHIVALANVMWDAMQASTPVSLTPGQWHLPYIDQDGKDWLFDALNGPDGDAEYMRRVILLRKVSAARCARLSYLTHEGRPTTVEEDLALYEKLVGGDLKHASPTEHQATPDYVVDLATAKMLHMIEGDYVTAHRHGNFAGWVQHRKLIPGENVTSYTPQLPAAA